MEMTLRKKFKKLRRGRIWSKGVVCLGILFPIVFAIYVSVIALFYFRSIFTLIILFMVLIIGIVLLGMIASHIEKLVKIKEVNLIKDEIYKYEKGNESYINKIKEWEEDFKKIELNGENDVILDTGTIKIKISHTKNITDSVFRKIEGTDKKGSMNVKIYEVSDDFIKECSKITKYIYEYNIYI